MSTPVHSRHSQLPPLMRRKEPRSTTLPAHHTQPTIPALLNFLRPNPASRSRSTSPSPSLPSLYLSSSPSSSRTHYQASSPPSMIFSTPPDSPTMHHSFFLDKPVQRPKDEQGLYLLLSVLESTQQQFQPEPDSPSAVRHNRCDLHDDDELPPISAHLPQPRTIINSTAVPCTPPPRTSIPLPQPSPSPLPITPSPRETPTQDEIVVDDGKINPVLCLPPSPAALSACPQACPVASPPSRVIVLPKEIDPPVCIGTRDISPLPTFVTLKTEMETERREECQPLSMPASDDIIVSAPATLPPIIREEDSKSLTTPIATIPDEGIAPSSESVPVLPSSPPASLPPCVIMPPPPSPTAPAATLLGPKTNKLELVAKSKPNTTSNLPSIDVSPASLSRSGPSTTAKRNKRKRQRRVSDVENFNYTSSSISGSSVGSPSPSTPLVSSSDKQPAKKKARHETPVKDKLKLPSTTASTTTSAAATKATETKKTNSSATKGARKVEESSPSSTEATVSPSPSSSSANDLCADLDLPSLLVDALVFGRVSFLSAPELVKSLVRDQPHLLERQGVQAWTDIAREVLAKYRFFGRIKRCGKDADGNKLEDAWYYESSFDPDRGRAETLAELAPPSSRRRKAKMGDRTYFYEPVDMNRWVVAAEEE